MNTHARLEALEARIAPAVLLAIESGTNTLISFDSAAPGTILSEVTITGLKADEIIAGIDSSATSGLLYGIGLVDDGATRTITGYRIDSFTGVATLVANGSTNRGDTDRYGFEFSEGFFITMNSLDQNYRFSFSSGVTGAALSDPLQEESIAAIAFDHPLGDGPKTMYGYNFFSDELVTIGDIDGTPLGYLDGVVKPIAKVRLDGNTISANPSHIGFDIGGPYGGPDTAWMSIPRLTLGTHLFTVDLTTAALTDLGKIGDGTRNFGGITVLAAAPAPMISTDGKTANWTDLDGDMVTLKITKGTLTPANFHMLAGVQGSVLGELKLNDATFTGTNITITAKPGANGDGLVNIGEIDATDVDLGAVTVDGDLQRILAGLSGGPIGLKSLKAASIARFGTDLVPEGEQPRSRIKSGFGSISIAGDYAGDMEITQGNGGSITIGGDVVGGSENSSGSIDTTSGVIIGKTVVKGDIIGGSGSFSGFISHQAKSITIGGSVFGGMGIGSGSVTMNAGAGGKLTIAGSVVGGDGPSSGALTIEGTVSVKIGGSLAGDDGDQSGTIRSFTSGTFLKSLTIGGDVKTASKPGGIAVERAGAITIGGSVIGSEAAPVNIIASGITAPTTAAESVALGKLTISGDVENAHIAAGLQTFALAAKTADAAIGAIKIGRNFIASSISAGINPVNGVFGDADDIFSGGNAGNAAILARIASITIGGQLIGTIGGAADSFGIVAEQIGALTIGKTKVALTANKDDLTLAFTADVRVREL